MVRIGKTGSKRLNVQQEMRRKLGAHKHKVLYFTIFYIFKNIMI
jgi:hypothetical protein